MLRIIRCSIHGIDYLATDGCPYEYNQKFILLLEQAKALLIVGVKHAR
jgi:hypothetical protein